MWTSCSSEVALNFGCYSHGNEIDCPATLCQQVPEFSYGVLREAARRRRARRCAAAFAIAPPEYSITPPVIVLPPGQSTETPT